MILFDWLATYLVHSTILLGLALVLTLLPALRDAAWQDAIWKAAMLAGVLSATVQLATPLGTVIEFEAPTAPASAPAERRADSGGDYTPPPSAERTLSPRMEPAGAGAAAPVASTVDVPLPAAATGFTPDPRTLALAGWCVGASWLLLGLLLRIRGERRLLADRIPVHGTERARMSGGLDLPEDVRLSRSDAVAAPLATRAREIIVPANFDVLPAAHRSAALAHELAHLRRHDPAWRLAVLTLARLFFIQPLNGLAERRIARSAEALSDRAAVRRTAGDSRSLAECLAHFAGATTLPAPATLSAMSAGRLPERIEALLRAGHEGRPERRGFLPLFLGVAMAGAVLLPGLTAGHEEGRETRSGMGTTVDVRDDDGHLEMSIFHRDRERAIRVKAEGVIRFADDFSDIVAIDRGGRFELRLEERGDRHEVDLRGTRDGLGRTYRINGRERAWDRDAQRWFAGALEVVLRTTGMHAEDRAQALLDSGGTAAVLAELDRIESDMVGRLYVSALARLAPLGDDELDAVIGYVDDEIGSDLETRLALSSVIDEQDLDRDQWARVLDATRTVQSDLEQRLLLAVAAEHMPEDRDLLERYLRAMEGIRSDLERRLTLVKLGDRLAAADEALLLRVVDAIAEIRSDLERRLALAAIVEHLETESGARAYIRAASQIDSDLELRLAFGTLLDHAELAEGAVVALVEAAGERIGSDLELRLTLTGVLDRYGDSRAVRGAVGDALEFIGSDFERNQVARRLGS